MIYQFFQMLFSVSLNNLFNNLSLFLIVFGVLILMYCSTSVRFIVMSVVLAVDVLVSMPWIACHTAFAYISTTTYSCGSRYSYYISQNFHFDLWYVWVGYIVFIAIWAHTYTYGIRRGV